MGAWLPTLRRRPLRKVDEVGPSFQPCREDLRENSLAGDLDYILAQTSELWEEIRGKRLFITGGTGFFGTWLLESFIRANNALDLGACALVLTRSPDAFRKKAPRLACDPAVRFHAGDVRNYPFPEGEFSHIIHAATTSAVATFNNEDPLIKFDTIYEGARHTLEFAVRCRAVKFLMTSSGSAYGKQPPDMTHIPEDYCGAPCPSDVNAALGEGKRAAEFLCSYYSTRYGIETKIARCFSFVGPHLPFDIHYAIGNFIRDALHGGPIQVKGDGTPRRSYLYIADLVIWLWTILFRGRSHQIYNVGSEEDLSIEELAHTVARGFQEPIKVRIATPPSPGCLPDRYVPATRKAQEELGLRQTIDLKTAIHKTAAFARLHPDSSLSSMNAASDTFAKLSLT